MLPIVFLGVALCPAQADPGAGTTSAEFLGIDAGARTAGLAGARTAVTGDAFGLMTNPALAAATTGVTLAFDHAEWFAGMDQNLGVVLVPTGRTGVLGVTANILGYGDLSRTTVTSGQAGISTGAFSARDYAIGLAWANRVLDRLDAGLALKLVSSTIDNRSAQAFASDLGLVYHTTDAWTIAASVQNLGTKLKLDRVSNPLPTTFRLGTAYSAWNRRLLLAADAVLHRDESWEAAVGAEFAVTRNFLLRAGYSSLADEIGPGLSVGAGFRHDGLQVDYAWSPHDDLADAHRVSLSYSFEPEQSTSSGSLSSGGSR